MKCKECFAWGCPDRTTDAEKECAHQIFAKNAEPMVLTGVIGGKSSRMYLDLAWQDFGEFIRKVKALRDVQNAHEKTMQYGFRNEAIRLGKEVDEMLARLNTEEI